MCLIAYIPAGKKMPEDYIDSAHYNNEDGIGIMSADGIHKFLGRKALKRAKRYLAELHEAEVEYAIHFRYATHGQISLGNCHPFELPNGNGWLMHNGVLSDYTARSTKWESDTAVFAKEHTSENASNEKHLEYWGEWARRIGSNKLCIMLPDASFILVNGSYGTRRDDIWYSQTYSLPRPKYDGPILGHYRGGDYYPTYGGFVRKLDHETGHSYLALPSPEDKPEPSDGYGRLLAGALARRYPDATVTDSVTPWDAWNRDKHGNDPVADADKALDAELEKHLQTNCAVCYKADVPVDKDSICEECLITEEAELDGSTMLPGWSEVSGPTPHKSTTCIECGVVISDDRDYCGEQYCTGAGYAKSGG